MIYGKRVYGKWHKTLVRFTFCLLLYFHNVRFVSHDSFQAASPVSSPVATYSQGILRLTVPYKLCKQEQDDSPWRS